MSARAYPLPQPKSGQDPRFTFGLALDIAKRIEAAGYPPVSGTDFVELQLALFRFLYQPEVLGAAGVAATRTEMEQERAALAEEHPTSQPATSDRGHGQDDARHALPPIGDGTAPRCGAAGPTVLFAHDVTCRGCLDLLAEESCRRCHVPFDPADTRFDGHDRWRGTPWCGERIDNCYEGDAGHRCVICEES